MLTKEEVEQFANDPSLSEFDYAPVQDLANQLLAAMKVVEAVKEDKMRYVLPPKTQQALQRYNEFGDESHE